MKVARAKPAVVKAPVYVTSDKYEIWYGNPISLGTIDNRGGYWYTADNMRFMSSRDAMEYLIRIHELSRNGNVPSAPIPEAVKKEAAKQIVAAKSKKIVKRAGATAVAAAPVSKPEVPLSPERLLSKEILDIFRRNPGLLQESSKD